MYYDEDRVYKIYIHSKTLNPSVLCSNIKLDCNGNLRRNSSSGTGYILFDETQRWVVGGAVEGGRGKVQSYFGTSGTPVSAELRVGILYVCNDAVSLPDTP